MPFLTRRYTRTYTDAEGHLITNGEPVFTLSGVITDDVDATTSPTRIVCSINSFGQLVGPDNQLGVLLPVLDLTSVGTEVQPQGRTFHVIGEPNSIPWQLATIAADPNPCDLATKPPASPAIPFFQWALEADLAAKVSKAGDTMTGALVLAADPLVALGAATKQYVDTHGGGGGAVPSVFGRTGPIAAQTGDYSADQVTGAERTANKGAAGGYASLDGGGHVPLTQLPAITMNTVWANVASQAAMLALAAEPGDVAVRTDISANFMLAALPASTLTNWVQLADVASPVTSVAGRIGAVTLSNTDISGLGTAATQNKVAAGAAGVLDATDATTTNSRAPIGAAGGDLSGSFPNPGVAKINGTSLAGLATGLLKNTTGTGVPSIAAAADVPTVAAGSPGPLSASDPTTTNSRAPSGAAGGVLTGNFPNPTGLAATAVTAGSYTNASLTVGADGRLTAAASGSAPVTSVAGTAGDISAVGTTSVTLDLVSTAVTPGSYTNANITVDAKGRLTAASSGSGGGSTSPLTTKGDIWGFSTVDARFPVGADGRVLQADSGQTLGVGYSTRTFDMNSQAVTNIGLASTMVGSPTVSTTTNGLADNSTPALAASGAPTYNSFLAATSIASAGTSSAIIRGFYANPTVTGAYVGELTGLEAQSIYNGIGVGLIAYGAVAAVKVQAGTVTTAIGVLASVSPTGGTITTGVCYDTNAFNLGGTLTTAIGLRIQNLAGSTNWGLQVGGYNSYFAGSTSFGQSAAPSFVIDAIGTISAASTSTSAPGFRSALTGAPAGSTTLAGFSDTTSMPIGSGSGSIYASYFAGPTVTGAGSATFYGVLVQGSSTGAYTGAPTGGSFAFTQNGSGTIGTGISVQATYQGAAGTTTLAYGMKASAVTTGGTITKWIGLGVSAIVASGAITTTVGLDIGVTNTLGGSTVWGMQVGNYQSFHQGKLAIGGNSSPANTVDIQAGALNYNVEAVTFASTITLDLTKGNVKKTTATSNVTIQVLSSEVAGQPLQVIVVNDATSNRTVTFGAGFRAASTLVGTISKAAVVSFISDGTSFFETGRATGL